MAKGHVVKDHRYVDKTVEKVIQETVQVLEEFDIYTLELTKEETKTLHDILASVGGDPYGTRRAQSDAILSAVENALDYRGLDPFYHDTEGEITFKEMF